MKGVLLIVAKIQESLLSYFGLAATCIIPFVAFAVFIHFLESIIQKRLAERFGWKSVLWTGWLGTPIHELSHAAMCWLFNHRIDEMALFKPDLKAGRLGYVKHSWRRGNWFEEFGNVLIGIAPLMGGSLVLLVLLRLFYPDVFDIQNAVESTGESTLSTSLVQNIFASLFSLNSILSLKFWIFVYLALCVSSHMAPSRSDYEGATKGTVMAILGLALAILILATALPDSEPIRLAALEFLMPLFVLMLVTAILCALATAVVSVAVGYFPQRYEVR